MTLNAKALEALKPCPFCGGEASLRDGGPGCFFVQCDLCNATSDDGSQDRAITRWNSRSALEALPQAGVSEEMVEAIRIAATIAESGQQFLEAVDALCDWLNGNDMSADHAAQKPDDFRRLCSSMAVFRAALSAAPAGHSEAAFFKAGVSEAQEWRCFHCDEVFTDEKAARDHFGTLTVIGMPITDPACCVDIATFRDMEHQLHRYGMEDSDKDRELATMQASHACALREEEEKGYGRGLRDGRAEAALSSQREEAVPVGKAAPKGWTSMPTYGEVSFSELEDAVAEAIYADRNFRPSTWEVDPARFIGHQIVPTINFNSLNRIVSAFVRSASSPVPADAGEDQR